MAFENELSYQPQFFTISFDYDRMEKLLNQKKHLEIQKK